MPVEAPKPRPASAALHDRVQMAEWRRGLGLGIGYDILFPELFAEPSKPEPGSLAALIASCNQLRAA